MAVKSGVVHPYHDLQLCMLVGPRVSILAHANVGLMSADRLAPVAFLPRTIPSSIVSCRKFARNTVRAFSFWRRVLTIWASFKLTQATVAIQRPFRKPDWPARAWSTQHRRAADVCFITFVHTNLSSQPALIRA